MQQANAGGVKKSFREDVLQYATERYGTAPEYLWHRLPDYAVLRHADNRKWYAVVMDVPRERLGLTGTGNAEILNVKCDPVMVGSLLSRAGILPAYHMHKGNWVTVLLDGTVDPEVIFWLLDMSFDVTAVKQAR